MKWPTFLIANLVLLQFAAAQINYTALRQAMVETQLEAREFMIKVLYEPWQKYPGKSSFPKDQEPYAYNDRPLPIGLKQTISQPYMVAYMTQAIKPYKNKKVLEIGTGSGYQAAVLAEIVDSVYTIEIVPELGQRASRILKQLNYDNVKVKVGDGYHGWPEHAPFDAIVVTAGAEEIPEPLIAQLKEGGLMIVPVGAHNSIRQLVLLKRTGQNQDKNVMAVRFVPFTREKN